MAAAHASPLGSHRLGHPALHTVHGTYMHSKYASPDHWVWLHCCPAAAPTRTHNMYSCHLCASSPETGRATGQRSELPVRDLGAERFQLSIGMLTHV